MTNAAAVDKISASEFTLFSPEYMNDPYPYFKGLREEDPVHFIEAIGVWLLASHKDVFEAFPKKEILMDWDAYQITRMGSQVVDNSYFKATREMLTGLEGAKHRAMKKLLRPFWSATRTMEHKELLKGIANKALDDIYEQGQAEIVREYIHKVPLAMISTFLGVPEEDRANIQQWIDDFHPAVEFAPMTQEQLSVVDSAVDGLEAYFNDLIKADKGNPDPKLDLTREMLEKNAELDEPFSMYQIVCNMMIMYFGGQDTQTKLSSSSLSALQLHPDQRQYLLEDPSMVWDCVDEFFRYDCPGQYTGRMAATDMEIGGRKIQQGQTILLGLASANRDPEAFENPDELNLRRPGMENLRYKIASFGGGRHTCLGVNIAHVSVPAILETIIARCPNLKLDLDNAERSQSILFRGYDTLPATW